MKTTNKYWIFLENLRKSGKVNMFGAVPYLVEEFCIPEVEAKQILSDWMKTTIERIMKMSKTGRKEVVKILRRRDGMSEKEANKLINECREALENGNYEAIQEYLGLEKEKENA